MNLQYQFMHPFLFRNWSTALLAVGLGLANSALTLLLPLSLGRFYEQLFGGNSNRGQALEVLGMGHLGGNDWNAFFGWFGTLILIRGMAEIAESRVTGGLGETYVRYLREQTFAHHLSLPLGVHRQKAVGKYLLRYSSDFGSLRRYLTKGLIGFTKDVLFLTLAGLLLLWLNPALTGLLVASLLPFLLLFRWLNLRLESHTAQRRNRRSAYLNHVATRLSAFETIKVFNRESIENEQFKKRSTALTEVNTGALNWQAGLAGLLPTAVYTMIFTALLGVHLLIPNGTNRLDGGVIITFILLTLSLRPVLRRLLRVGTVWQSGRLSLQKLADFLNQPAEQNNVQADLTLLEGHVEFDAVSFAYMPGKSVLTDFTLSARAGTITQIPGGPGAGKTTAFNLLLGLYTPDSGIIRLDGQNIANCATASVRRQVTLVSAAVPLLGRTIFEAISYSRKAEKRPRAEALLNKVQTIADLPARLSLDDPIGEQGRVLSEGQQSVLRLVRALLTRKPILLLDEPFAGITDAGAAQLMRWLDERSRQQTILLASSRTLTPQALCKDTLITTR